MKFYRITAEGGLYRLPCANCGVPRVVEAVVMVGPDGKERIVCAPPASVLLSIPALPAEVEVVANAPRSKPAPEAPKPRLRQNARRRAK